MPRSTASPEMSTVDRLSMPKERSKGIELFGYTLLERLKEMRDIMKIKEARMERLQQTSHEEHDLQEKVITLLRREIKVKEMIIIKAGNFEQQMVSSVLKEDRRPRLQLRNSDVQGAMEALDEWFSFHKNVLNLFRSGKRKREKYYEQKLKEIVYLDQISSAVDEEIVKKSVRRYENNIAKLKVKYKTAQHLQTSYLNILERYQEESLLLSNRLEAIERDLRMHQMELRDLLEMKTEIVISLDHTLYHVPKTEVAVQKASAGRKDIEAATRKAERDLRVEKLLSRQRRRSDRTGTEEEGYIASIPLSEDETTEMLKRQLDFDTIKSLTSSADANSILEAFVKQSVVNDEVTELKRQRERERKRLVEELERLKTDRQRRKFEEQNAISRGKKLLEEMHRRILDEEKALEQKREMLKSRGDILFQVDKGVTSIFEKLLYNQQEGVADVDDALFRDQRNAIVSSTSDRLYSCQKVLTSLVSQLESSSDRGEVLTDCLLFGEMVDDHLDLLIPAGSRLVPRKDADALNEFEYDQKEVSGALTREDMKKQHRRFYDARKRRAASARASIV